VLVIGWLLVRFVNFPYMTNKLVRIFNNTRVDIQNLPFFVKQKHERCLIGPNRLIDRLFRIRNDRKRNTKFFNVNVDLFWNIPTGYG